MSGKVNSGAMVLESKTQYLMDAVNTGASYSAGDSEGSARREAERLARMYPGKRFLVLKVVGYADVEPTPPPSVYTVVE